MLLATLSVIFFSCSNDKGFVGTWESVDDPELIFIISKDHSIIYGYYDEEDNDWYQKYFCTYTYQDNILTFITEYGTERNLVSVDGKTMTLTLLHEEGESEIFTLKRRKPVKM